MSRGLKERTPAQLAVLAQAREKAKIVIAERAKLNALQKTAPEPVSEEEGVNTPTQLQVRVEEFHLRVQSLLSSPEHLVSLFRR